jgi:centromere protein C
MKTALGSSPRRQSSMGPRAQSANPPSSPLRAVSHPVVNRLLDFEEEEEESGLQETPALSGSGMQRRKRTDIYEIEESPIRGQSEVLEESIQEEIIATEDSVMFNRIAEESYIADIGNDTTIGAEVEISEAPEEEEAVSELPKQPAKRGRKRKSDVIESPAQEEQDAPKARKRGAAAHAQVPMKQKKGKKAAPAPVAQPRRSKRVSDIVDEEPSTMLDVSEGASEQIETPSVVAKPRGRPRKVKEQVEQRAPAKEKQKAKQKVTEQEKEADNDSPVFKKPKMLAKSKKKPEAKSAEKKPEADILDGGRLVDVHGKPISKDDMEQMSVTSVGSRFGRGRHLSVFRELDPDAVARVGRTGRHRVAPIDFWRNESVQYDDQGNMQAIVKNALKEPVPTKQPNYRHKGKKRSHAALEEEEEVELEKWEEDEGVFEGLYKDYDPVTESGGDVLIESSMIDLSTCLTDHANVDSRCLGTEGYQSCRSRRQVVQIFQIGVRGRRQLHELGLRGTWSRSDEAYQERATHAYVLPCPERRRSSQSTREPVPSASGRCLASPSW